MTKIIWRHNKNEVHRKEIDRNSDLTWANITSMFTGNRFEDYYDLEIKEGYINQSRLLEISQNTTSVIFTACAFDAVIEDFPSCKVTFDNCSFCKNTVFNRVIQKHMQFNACNLIEGCFVGCDIENLTIKQSVLAGALFINSRVETLITESCVGLDVSSFVHSSVDHVTVRCESAQVNKLLRYLVRDDQGFIVYKLFGNGKPYASPPEWEIKSGSIITAVPNSNPLIECSNGVNFGDAHWVYGHYSSYSGNIWKCRIRYEDIATLVVPYAFSGKARIARLELIDSIDVNTLASELDDEKKRKMVPIN